MSQRATLLIIGMAIGALAWQRFWSGVVVGAVVGLWLVLDEKAIESLDSDRPYRYNRD